MVQARIAQRFDTLAKWQSNNIVLLNGELAVVSCENQIKFKVGNGISSFNQLPFVDQEVLSTKWVTANAVSQGLHAESVPYGLAAGSYLSAGASFSQVLGVDARSLPTDQFSFVWNGDTASYGIGEYYDSHGEGTFSINPKDGLSGFYIGDKSLASVIVDSASRVFIKDPSSPQYVDGKIADLSVIKLTNAQYAAILTGAGAQPNAIYIISDDFHDAWGQQIKNLSAGTDLSDAATVGQLSSSLSSKQDILSKTTAEWSSIPAFVPARGQIVVWTDHGQIEQNGSTVDVPGFKVGDGSAANVDLPFVGDDLSVELLATLAQHAALSTHLSAGERETWNHKITIGSLADPTDDGVVNETLVITRN